MEKLLTSLGTGEAAITVLTPKGVPTPLAATRLIAPDSSMDPLDDAQFQAHVAASALQAKYGTVIDRDSAYDASGGDPPEGRCHPPVDATSSSSADGQSIPSALSDLLFGSVGPAAGGRGMLDAAVEAAARSVGSGVGRQFFAACSARS
jgi:hypothetical protein